MTISYVLLQAFFQLSPFYGERRNLSSVVLFSFFFFSIVLISLKYEHCIRICICICTYTHHTIGYVLPRRYMDGGAIGNAWHASQVTYTRDKEGRQGKSKTKSRKQEQGKKIG